MKSRLIIIGAGCHGRVIADIAQKSGYTDVCFVDDRATGKALGFPIIGKTDDIERLRDGRTEFIIGIGDNGVRRAIAERFDADWGTLIHPSSQIASHVSVGRGTVAMAGTVVNGGTSIGAHCIINTCGSVDHDCVIGDFSHIGVGSHVAGIADIGKNVFIGAGATVINGIHICDGTVVGAGAVVIRSIRDRGTYVGVPAVRIK